MATLADIIGQHANQPQGMGGEANTLGSVMGKKKIDIWRILGALGDGLSVYGGGQPIYATRRHDRRMQERQGEQALDLAERRGDIDLRIEQWKMANEPPDMPPEAKLVDWYMNATPEQQAAFEAVKPIISQGPYGQEYTPRSAIFGDDEMTGRTIPDPRKKQNIPSGNPLAPTLSAILEDARNYGRNVMGGR